ncbi:hypothetical protein [Sphingorhabdus sp.]|uniref:hypothetical protein n=1 Tax=Sphingorhabdus sp. TaxID=1902408 RepID=UPI0037CAAA5A
MQIFEMDNREEVRAEITLAVGLHLKLGRHNQLFKGWLQLFERGIDPTSVAEGQSVPAEALQELLRSAKSCAGAFDACSTLAGLNMLSGGEVPPALGEFAANVLLGRATCPKKGKRTVANGAHKDVTRYIILRQALRFFPMQKGKGLRTENLLSTKSEYPADAFEMIARALHDAGLPTTESQLKNLLNHPSKHSIRKIGDWAMHCD